MTYTLEDWQDAKEDVDISKARLDEITLALSQQMLEEGLKSEIQTVKGVEYRVTVVQRETMKFDEDSLYQAMGKRAFSKISNLKLDSKKLEAAIKDGAISAELVSRNTVISKSNPFIRVSLYVGED